MAGEGHVLVNFGAVEQASGDVEQIAGQIAQQLGDLKSFLQPLVATWEGTASADWRALQGRWDTTAQDLHTVLQDMARALRTAGSNYSSAEKTNAAIWG